MNTEMMPDQTPERLSRAPSQHYVLHVKLKHLQCSLPLHNVERVMPLMALQILPSSPSYMAGLMNHHGVSIPVIDLSIRMGLPISESYHLETPLVICCYEGKLIALIVDSVVGVDIYTDQDLQMQHDDTEQFKAFFKSVINTQQGLSLILDLAMLAKIEYSSNYDKALQESGSLTEPSKQR